MSILIKGMEMPKAGQTITIVENIDGKIYGRLEPVGDWCQLVGYSSVPLSQVGQTVYYAFVDSPVINHVVPFQIVEIRMYEDETIYIDDSDNEWTESDFGRIVFLTREEAEAAMEAKRCGI